MLLLLTIDVSTWIAGSGFALALTTTLVGALIWYSNSEKKKYAAERDFNHLKNNQAQMSQGLDLILRTLDNRFDVVERDIHEIRITLNIKAHNNETHSSS